MPVNTESYKKIIAELNEKKVQLVAVSKIKPIEDILELFHLGQKDFGENYVQELISKHEALKHLEINWHFIGHLQTNKVKYIAPFVHLIHGVDSLKLLQEINKQAQKNNRVIHCLLQLYIAKEETKFGLNETEVEEIMTEVKNGKLNNIAIKGFMAMASFVDDEHQIRSEFKRIIEQKNKYNNLQELILSFGMSQDYKIAIEEGSNMVRIGSLLFGKR